MKRIILSVALLLAGYCANAQIVTDAGTFTKPVEGTTILEINLIPDLSGGSVFSLPTVSSGLGLVGVKLRDFSTDKKAMRYGLHVSVYDSGVSCQDTDFAIAASIGVERHMAGAERLSTYWGYEGNVGYVTNNDGTSNLQENRFGVGASLFSGFDYYVMPKIYVGAELGYSAALVALDPEQGKNTTSLEFSPGVTPSIRLGWQF